MYKTLLVPVDGSAFSEEALPVAAEVARRSGAALQVAHVHVAWTASPVHVEGRPVIDAELRSLRREHERAYLDGLRERLPGDLRVATGLLDGRPAEALARHARETGADLIVMTTHGRGGVERLWLGSVADQLVRGTDVPVLLVRPGGASGGPPELGHLLIPLDGSALAAGVLDPAVELGGLWGARYTVLQVVEPYAWVGPVGGGSLAVAQDEVTRRREGLAREYLEGVAGGLRRAGHTVTAVVVESPRPAAAILREARERQVDLVALATRGRSGLARLLVGSVADKLLRASHLPLLVHRPGDGSAWRCSVRCWSVTG